MFIKRAGDASAVFARIDLFAGDVVGDLTKRAASELQWGVDAGHVELFLVRRGGEDTPLAAEQQKALEIERLGEGWGLSRAGIADGAWLLAKITAAPASKLGKTLQSTRARSGEPLDPPCCRSFDDSIVLPSLPQLRVAAAAACQGRSSCPSRMLTSRGPAP